jgi:carboxylesterase type B
MGGATDKRYNLSFIVENSVEIGKPIIGLSMAYRLSAWGFLDGEEVRDEGSTNVGLHDQRFALQWIQANIGAFGGDPKKVTIWGESAGAWSTGIHTISYGGRDDGLFSGVIGESGNSVIPQYNATAAQSTFENVTQAAGCGDADNKLDCLRQADYNKLNNAFNVTGLSFPASPDGSIIPTSAYNAMLNGDFVKVPYLIGTNSDEGSGGFGATGINNDSDFRAYLISEGFNESTAPIIEAVYPDIPAIGIPATLTYTLNSTYGYQFKRASAFGGDFAMTAGRRLINQQYARYNVTSYAYRFDTIPYPLPAFVGVAHFQEVAFVFDNTEGLGYAENPFQGMPQSYLDLAELMSKMWVSFIATGDPNGHGLEGKPEWPVYMNGEGGKIESGQGGYGKDYVFHANDTGPFVEDDTYRATGIAALNSMWGSVFGR